MVNGKDTRIRLIVGLIILKKRINGWIISRAKIFKKSEIWIRFV